MKNLNEKIDLLLKAITDLSETLKIQQNIDLNKSQEKTITVNDLVKYYCNVSFEEFYNMCREYQNYEANIDVKGKSKYLDENSKFCFKYWDKSCTDNTSTMSRLISCLMYFDISEIANQIIVLNSSKKIESKIVRYDVEDLKSISDWYNSLLSSLSCVINYIIKNGEADEKDTFKIYKSVNIYLESIYQVSSDVPSRNLLRIYYTDNVVASVC